MGAFLPVKTVLALVNRWYQRVIFLPYLSPKNAGRAAHRAALQLVKKVSCGTFLTALSAEHFERVQNAISKNLDIARFLAAVYLI